MNTLLRGLSTVSTQCVPVTTTTSSGCNGQHAPEIHSSEAPVTSIEERTVTQVTVNRVRREGLEDGVNERDKFLTKVFFEAVEKEVIGLVRSLIEQGVDVNTKDNRGQTALHYAAKKKNLEVVEYLVLQGADVNAKNDSVEMPLHWAVRWARVEVVRFLVEQGADVHAKDGYGETPLHWGAKQGDLEVVKFLVEKGANVYEQNNSGERPLDIAINQSNYRVCCALREIEKSLVAQRAVDKPAERKGNFTVAELREIMDRPTNIRNMDVSLDSNGVVRIEYRS